MAHAHTTRLDAKCAGESPFFSRLNLYYVHNAKHADSSITSPLSVQNTNQKGVARSESFFLSQEFFHYVWAAHKSFWNFRN